MIKITDKFLSKHNACSEGVQWWCDNGKEPDPIKTIKLLMSDNYFDWANWLIVRLMTHDQKIKYAIYAAEQVIDIYEKKYPDDKRPREAILAAKKYLKNKTIKNKNAAAYAAYAAYATYAAIAARVKKSLESKIIKYGLTLVKP